MGFLDRIKNFPYRVFLWIKGFPHWFFFQIKNSPHWIFLLVFIALSLVGAGLIIAFLGVTPTGTAYIAALLSSIVLIGGLSIAAYSSILGRGAGAAGWRILTKRSIFAIISFAIFLAIIIHLSTGNLMFTTLSALGGLLIFLGIRVAFIGTLAPGHPNVRSFAVPALLIGHPMFLASTFYIASNLSFTGAMLGFLIGSVISFIITAISSLHVSGEAFAPTNYFSIFMDIFWILIIGAVIIAPVVGLGYVFYKNFKSIEAYSQEGGLAGFLNFSSLAPQSFEEVNTEVFKKLALLFLPSELEIKTGDPSNLWKAFFPERIEGVDLASMGGIILPLLIIFVLTVSLIGSYLNNVRLTGGEIAAIKSEKVRNFLSRLFSNEEEKKLEDYLLYMDLRTLWGAYLQITSKLLQELVSMNEKIEALLKEIEGGGRS